MVLYVATPPSPPTSVAFPLCCCCCGLHVVPCYSLLLLCGSMAVRCSVGWFTILCVCLPSLYTILVLCQPSLTWWRRHLSHLPFGLFLLYLHTYFLPAATPAILLCACHAFLCHHACLHDILFYTTIACLLTLGVCWPCRDIVCCAFVTFSALDVQILL